MHPAFRQEPRSVHVVGEQLLVSVQPPSPGVGAGVVGTGGSVGFGVTGGDVGLGVVGSGAGVCWFGLMNQIEEINVSIMRLGDIHDNNKLTLTYRHFRFFGFPPEHNPEQQSDPEPHGWST